MANTQLTGTITGSQISSNTLSNTVFQTGSVENYMNAAGLGFGMRNRIINGAMVIDQRNAGAAVTATTSYPYTLDRWQCGGSVSSKFTVQQSSTAPTGFVYSSLITSSSAYTVGAGENFVFFQNIEGTNTADLMWGTANAQTVTLSFWVRSSLTGTFGGAIQNSATNRSYPFTYTISTANTFEYKTITIAGDTSGTWLTTNGIGIIVRYGLGVGATSSGTAGAWAGANYLSATGAVSVVGTNAATWAVTGIQLEKGSTATSFDYRFYGTELVLCQRYFQTIKGTGRHFIGGNGSVSGCFPTAYLRVTMRDTPSYSASSVSHFTVEGLTGGGQATATALSINAVTLDTVTIQATSAGSASATAAQVFGNTGAAMSSFSAEL